MVEVTNRECETQTALSVSNISHRRITLPNVSFLKTLEYVIPPRSPL